LSILNKIVSYLAAFFIFILLLWLIGFVNSSLLELLSYFSLALGISIVLISFGNDKKGILFSGTIIFLLGLIFFILNNFDFDQTNNLMIPAFLFILGTGFFVLFLDGFSNKKNLILSALFWLTGFIFILFLGEFSISTFTASLKDVAFSFWTVILLVVGAFLLLKTYTKK